MNVDCFFLKQYLHQDPTFGSWKRKKDQSEGCIWYKPTNYSDTSPYYTVKSPTAPIFYIYHNLNTHFRAPHINYEKKEDLDKRQNALTEKYNKFCEKNGIIKLGCFNIRPKGYSFESKGVESDVSNHFDIRGVYTFKENNSEYLWMEDPFVKTYNYDYLAIMAVPIKLVYLLQLPIFNSKYDTLNLI